MTIALSASDIETEVQQRLILWTARYEAQLADLRQQRDKWKQRAVVAEWAVAGLIEHRPTVHLTIQALSLLQAKDVLDLQSSLAHQVTRGVMKQAQMEFTKHANYSALLSHVGYLERRLTENDVRFQPHTFKPPDDLAYKDDH